MIPPNTIRSFETLTNGGSRHRPGVSLMLGIVIAIIAGALPAWSQPESAHFIRTNRLRLIRHAPSIYRPAFGSIDRKDEPSRLDSLIQRGFDPEIDLFGYDSSIVRFTGGEFRFNGEGRTRMIVRYPVYPGYLDTVDLSVYRDREGLAVRLAHRSIPIVVDSGSQSRKRQRTRTEYYQTPELEIYAGFVGDTRKFYYQTKYTSGQFHRSARQAFRAFIPFGLWNGPWKKRLSDEAVYEVEARRNAESDILTFSGYDSTIIGFSAREVIARRPGSTPVTVHFPKETRTAIIDVDSNLVVRVRQEP